MLGLIRQRRFAPLFWTQFLGAFNDNVFKSALVVALTLGTIPRAGLSLDTLTNLASALLILPFFVFSALAGQLADAVDKAALARALKLAEVLVMGLACVGFARQSVPLLLTTLLLLGVQSAFFGPIKYAILPQHLEDRELLAANGLVEMGTFVAILAGTLLGGVVVAIEGLGVALLCALVVIFAIAGVLTSRAIPAAPPTGERIAIDWNLARGTARTVALARRNRPAFRAILGASWFWFLGALLLAQVPAIATTVLGGGEESITRAMAVFTVGIGIGSVLCEKLSGGRMELGIVAPAGLALFALLVDLAFAIAGAAPTRVLVDLFGLGFFGGIFVVPLYALMQQRSAPAERSRIVAANNIVNAIFMVAAASFAIALRASGASIAVLIGATAALQLIAVFAVAILTREFLARLLVAVLIRAMYRVRIEGIANVPDHGPALLVANHVSYADALIVGGLCRRPVRFVMDHRIHDMPVLGWLFRALRTIPIAPRSEDPARLAAAYDAIDRALGEGELVVIFPEGKLTRDGEVDAFRPGVERILAKKPVPVVPIALRGLWGSFFSYAGGMPMAKLPRRFRSRVEVLFGAAIPAGEAKAPELRTRVLALRGVAR